MSDFDLELTKKNFFCFSIGLGNYDHPKILPIVPALCSQKHQGNNDKLKILAKQVPQLRNPTYWFY